MPKLASYCGKKYRTDVVKESFLERRIKGFSPILQFSWLLPYYKDREGVLSVLINSIEDSKLPIEILETNLEYHRNNQFRELFLKGFVYAGSPRESVFIIKINRAGFLFLRDRLTFIASENNYVIADILKLILETLTP